MNWDKHEELVHKMLTAQYTKKGVEYVPMGESDSTKSDILVTKNGKQQFYIETKMKSAQSGQFVVLDDGEAFRLSKQNADMNTHSAHFLKHMNTQRTEYSQCGTAGVKLNIPTSVQFDWIKEHYVHKGVSFFATINAGELCLTKLENIDKAYSVSCKYRVKRSGTRALIAKWIPELKEAYSSTFGTTLQIVKEGEYLLKGVPDGTTELVGKTNKYHLRRETNGNCTVRIKSKTANANVIFSLAFKGGYDDNSDYSNLINTL